jgi:hypothetical protein
MDTFRYKWLQKVGEYYRLVALEQEVAEATASSDELITMSPKEHALS